MIPASVSPLVVLALSACDPAPPPPAELGDHGPIAQGIYAPLGEPIPGATAEQLATFARGHEVAIRRFDRADGLGPSFNVTFCAACHEKPTIGGAAGLYRNFLLGGRQTVDGAFFFGESAGNTSGVVRMYAYGGEFPNRPPVPDTTEIIAQRNAIPMFGVGLLADLSSDEILLRADEDDADGDGISGKPNWDRGFVGRFGMKSQTVSIEKFIRGPLFNHLGVTTDPLTEEQRARLPVDSSSGATGRAPTEALYGLRAFMQAAAPDGPLVDDDGVADPEMTTDELFDLVSFAMLLAAPEPDADAFGPPHLRGRQAFDRVGCGDCHAPRLRSKRGPLPAYTDLLIHDMGPELADGIIMEDASGSEFRTAPLWGVVATGPYLHDGRAQTLDEAIVWHGGEAEAARDAYLAMPVDEQQALTAFLEALGGKSQRSDGLIPPGTPIAPVGTWGGPVRALAEGEQGQFLTGRDLFDREFGLHDGVGGPRFNGDSCRACHFEPVVGGAGPRDVNVMRHGLVDGDGRFIPPAVGTVLHKQTALDGNALRAQPEATIFEHRQTPHLFGLGVIEAIPESAILAAADPMDLDGDGISGKPSIVDGGRLGRFGWKAQVPSIDEFVRDAVQVELGMTLPYREGMTFGALFDNDEVPDPEMNLEYADALAFYLRMLAPPPRTRTGDPAAELGEALFVDVGCARCHTPSLDGVPVHSDLLLHEILPDGAPGTEDASAEVRELRTPPLWGVSQTKPYLHSGEADTLEQAIVAHDGEATAIREAFVALPDADRAAIVAFLETL